MANTQVITKKLFYRLSERRKRISVDIDEGEPDKIKVLRIYYALQYVFPNCRVSIDRTSHGWHVKVVGSEIEAIQIRKRLFLREQLDDDPMRLEYDLSKLEELDLPLLVDTLFTMKARHKAVLAFAHRWDKERRLHRFYSKIHIVEKVNPTMLP